MRSLIIILIFIKGVMMASSLESVKINGVVVPFVYEQSTHLPLVSAQIVFKNSGSIFDEKKAGLANVVARLLGEGTMQKDGSNYADALDEKAIHISSRSGTETFVIELSTLKSELQRAEELLKELITAPRVKENSLKHVKTMLNSSLARKENDLDYIASLELKKLLFKGSALENPRNGTKQSIKNITLSDVKNFIDSNLILNNILAVVGGDLSLDEAKLLLLNVLSSLKKGIPKELKHYKVSANKEIKYTKRVSDQAYVYFGSPLDLSVNDSQNIEAKIAFFVLGSSGFGSRLMEEIRVKRGLAYSAYGRSIVNKSHSYFSGYLQTKISTQEEAIKIVKDVVNDFVKKGITQEELESAKKFILGSEPLRVETLSQRLGRSYLETYRGLTLGASIEDLEKIKKISLEDVNIFITKHKEITNLSFSIVTKND